MKNSTHKHYIIKRSTQMCAVILVLLLAGAALWWPIRPALAQNDNSNQERAEATIAGGRTSSKSDRGAGEVTDALSIPQQPGIEVASNYGFATATSASLTDMSSGTTQLLAANIDDTASPLTNIGFDFYFQGTRFTQFG